MTKELTDYQIDLMSHALGADRGFYRNYFAASPNTKDFNEWVKLEEMGYAKSNGARPEIFGKLVGFWVTDEGIEIVKSKRGKKRKSK